MTTRIERIRVDIDSDDQDDATQNRVNRKTKKKIPKCAVDGCRFNSTSHYNLCKRHAGTRLIEKEDCAICMEQIDKCPLSCGHWIHIDCVIQSGKKECPICKSDVRFTKEQSQSYRQRQRELKEASETRLETLNEDGSAYFMSNDLILYIDRVTNGRNTRISRQMLIQILLDC